MNSEESRESGLTPRRARTGWWAGQPLERKLPVTFTALVLVMAGFYTAALYHQIKRSSANAVAARLQQVGTEIASLAASNNEQRHNALRLAVDSMGVDKTIARLAARSATVFLLDSAMATSRRAGPPPTRTALDRLDQERMDIVRTEHGTTIGHMFRDGPTVYYWTYTSLQPRTGRVLAQLQKFSGTNSRSRAFEKLIGGASVLLTNAGEGAAPWVALDGTEVQPPERLSLSQATHIRSGIRYITHAAAIPGTPWVVVAEMPQSATNDEALALALRTLPVTAAFLVVGGVIAWLLGKRVTRPVRQLANAALAIGGGAYHRRVQVHERGDLGMMANAFNRMAAELEQSHAILDDRVRKRTADLEIANNELQAFSYSVSHDLRSPLRSIDGFSQALLEDYGPQLDSTAQDYLRRLRAGAQRMGQLIDDMLLLSRVTRQPVDATEVNISAVAEDLIQEMRDQDAHRNVQADIEPGVLVYGDYGLLRIAMQNLIANAWKFTRDRETATISIGTLVESDHQVLYVRDNGAGFDMAYSNQLFSPFQRLHSTAEFAGTGIGLATVQRIVTRHGGRVWASADVGQGATFYFTIERK